MKFPPSFLIGLDQGSSSTKAVLFNPKNSQIITRVRYRINTKRYEKEGRFFVEQDPEEILETSNSAIQRILKKTPAGSQINIGIASQRSSFLLVDKKTIKPLTPIISWQDMRGISYVSKLSHLSKEIYLKTGLYLTPYYSLTKLLWVFNNNKNIKRKAERGEVAFCPIPTYLVLKWTQGKVFATDPTLAQRSLLMNLKNTQWDHELLSKLNIPISILPKIKQSHDDYGKLEFFSPPLPLTPSPAHPLSRSPSLTAMIGDQQSAYTALQSLPGAEKTALINLGTGGFLIVPTGSSPARVPGLLSGIQISNKERRYMLEGTVNSIQGTLKWMLGLGILKKSEPLALPRLNSAEFLRRVPVVSGGFGGLAAPFWRNDIHVTISGLTRLTTREDLFACLLLGIAHLFSEILDPLRKTPHFPKRLTASGGLSRNRGLLQILSNYLGLPIHPANDADLTALGACAAASEKKVRLPVGILAPVRPEKKITALLGRYKEKARRQLRLVLAAGSQAA